MSGGKDEAVGASHAPATAGEEGTVAGRGRTAAVGRTSGISTRQGGREKARDAGPARSGREAEEAGRGKGEGGRGRGGGKGEQGRGRGGGKKGGRGDTHVGADAVSPFPLPAASSSSKAGSGSSGAGATAPPPSGPSTAPSEAVGRQGEGAGGEGPAAAVVVAVGPRVELVDGQIVINQKSLEVVARPEDGGEGAMEEVTEDPQQAATYNSFTSRTRATRWTDAETRLFYQALRQCGTDFTTMASLLFAGRRDRAQLKNKFKKEEKQHGVLVYKYLDSTQPLPVLEAGVHDGRGEGSGEGDD